MVLTFLWFSSEQASSRSRSLERIQSGHNVCARRCNCMLSTSHTPNEDQLQHNHLDRIIISDAIEIVFEHDDWRGSRASFLKLPSD